MLETLYKTKTPELGKSECYEISLKALPGTLPHSYAFREDHGWWDDSTKIFIHQVTTINTAEEGITFEEAEAMYVKARTNRVKSGFVHSFAPDYYGDKPYEYQLLEAQSTH
jgi:hypothetical protein